MWCGLVVAYMSVRGKLGSIFRLQMFEIVSKIR
jgi:hypothetical protein